MPAEPEPSAFKLLLKKTFLVTLLFSSVLFLFSNPKKFLHLFQSKKTVKKVTAVPKLAKQVKPKVKKAKKLYLTFDDGPSSGTKTVLSIVQQEQIPVTNFIIGQEVFGSERNAALYDSLLACPYVELANHSYTHACKCGYKSFYADEEKLANDFIRCTDSLHFKNNLARTPGRNIWRLQHINDTDLKSSIAAADTLAANGYDLMGWDLEWHYNNKSRIVQTTEQMLAQLDSVVVKNTVKTPNKAVILMHDRNFMHPDDSGSLHNFIKAVKRGGKYEFEFASEYISAGMDTLHVNALQHN
jgi:peptidoglycan-N-acetylglucosamine deacetylase